MTVQTSTAQDLVEEVFLFGRTLRSVLGSSDDSELSPALLGVLHVLAGSAPCRQSELASRLCVSQSSLSRQIAELVTAGLVERRTDPVDGRAALVHLSAAGTDFISDTRQRRADRLRQMLADWSQGEAEDALTALRHLKTTFSSPARTPVTGSTEHSQGEFAHDSH